MSIRLSTEKLSEEDLIKLQVGLRIEGEHSFFEKQNAKRFNRPLPDRSVDCFIHNKQNGYIDVPFHLGRLYYRNNGIPENINALLPKNKTEFEFIGKPMEPQIPFIALAKDYLDREDCVLLHARPGFGKTFISTYLAHSYQYTTLVIVNRRGLLTQWKETVEKYTTGKAWIVGEKYPEYKVHFLISMIDSVKKLGTDLLNRMGTVILDEAHMLATPTQIPTILQCKPQKLILCTATPDKDLRTTTILDSLVWKNRVVKRYDGYLKVITYRTGILINERKKGRYLDWPAYLKEQQLSEERNQQIVDWVKMNLKSKILIMTWGADHAPHISSLIEKEGIQTDWMSKNKKKYKDGTVLVGSFGKIGVGHDPSATEDWDGLHYDLLLLVGTTVAMALLEQLWGRAFRSKKPHIVIFLEENKKAESHWKEMRKLAKMYQAEIQDIRNPIAIK